MEAKSAAGHPATTVLCLLFHAVPKLCPSTAPQGGSGHTAPSVFVAPQIPAAPQKET